MTSAVILAAVVWAERPDARVVLPAAAEALPFFATGEFAYNRHDIRDASDEQAAAYRRSITRILDPRLDPAVLIALLSDLRPKVRTLAAAALYARDEPAHLPRLAALLGDPADTFPAVTWSSAPRFRDEPAALVPRTVGQSVRRLVGLYVGDQGDGPMAVPFATYWAVRKDRPHCAGWFRVFLARASGGISPTQADRVWAIRAVRERIDRVPEPDRTLTLLKLANEAGGDVLASDADLIAGCKAVGRDRLLKLLRREPLSDDPDLRPTPRGDSEYGRSPRRFVLTHAAELLTPADADALLDTERAEVAAGLPAAYRSPDWAIAAAALRPDRAKEFLTAAWARFQTKYDSDRRAELALARWRRGVDDGTGFVVGWFYTDPLQRGAFGFGRVRFLNELDGTPADRRLVAALARDDRFAALDWQSLKVLCGRLNAWEAAPVVPADRLRAAWHPYGEGHFEFQQAEATAQHPAETAMLLAELDRWRADVRMWAARQ